MRADSIVAAVLVCGVAASVARADVTGDVKALQEEYRQQRGVAIEALRAAKTPEEKTRVYRERAPNPAKYFVRAMTIAKGHPDDPGAFDALVAALGFADTAWNWKDEGVITGEAVKMLAAGWVENPRLGEAFSDLRNFYTPEARGVLEEAARRNPSREVRGQAIYVLAGNLQQQAESIERFREVPAFRTNLQRWNGKPWVEQIEKDDPKQLEGKAISLLERASKEFGDVKAGDEQIGERSKRMLFQLRNLGIGKTAPEIVGTDQDGVEMRLSQFRGKAVALVFWGGWCGPCMAAVPHERELVNRMRGKPFVMLGVNTDEPGKLKEIVREKQINWRSWADGSIDGPHPISRGWNVNPWPKIYLIDAGGVIRYNQLGFGEDGELDWAVEGLVGGSGGGDRKQFPSTNP